MKAKDVKPFGKKEVLEVARLVLGKGNACDHCLGRQLAHVSTGFSNDERGAIVRKLLKAGAPKGKCAVCNGIFRKLGKYADDAAARLKKLEFFCLKKLIPGSFTGFSEPLLFYPSLSSASFLSGQEGKFKLLRLKRKNGE